MSDHLSGSHAQDVITLTTGDTGLLSLTGPGPWSGAQLTINPETMGVAALCQTYGDLIFAAGKGERIITVKVDRESGEIIGLEINPAIPQDEAAKSFWNCVAGVRGLPLPYPELLTPPKSLQVVAVDDAMVLEDTQTGRSFPRCAVDIIDEAAAASDPAAFPRPLFPGV